MSSLLARITGTSPLVQISILTKTPLGKGEEKGGEERVMQEDKRGKGSRGEGETRWQSELIKKIHIRTKDKDKKSKQNETNKEKQTKRNKHTID